MDAVFVFGVCFQVFLSRLGFFMSMERLKDAFKARETDLVNSEAGRRAPSPYSIRCLFFMGSGVPPCREMPLEFH